MLALLRIVNFLFNKEWADDPLRIIEKHMDLANAHTYVGNILAVIGIHLREMLGTAYPSPSNSRCDEIF